MTRKPKLRLQCPSTSQALRLSGHEWDSAGGPAYPIVDGIPWLFPDPKHTLAEWRERASLSIDYAESEIADLKTSLKNSSSALTRERLENLRALKIRHLEMLRRTLEPLKPFAKLSLQQKRAYGYRLPLRQGLLGYVPNLIRDWSGLFENENSELFESTVGFLKESKPVLESTDLRVLVLGAGAARLAYDLAHRFPNSHIIAFDLNPLLLLAAKRINEGETLRGVELSVSPKNPMEPGRDVELRAPKGPAPNLDFVFGDVYALPFQDASFDICISPWLVDIVPRHLENLCTSVARVTKPGGAWVNSGSWHFSFSDESENLSLPEAEEVASQMGWKPLASKQSEVAYLQSGFDGHRRFETVTQFVWERDASAVSTSPPIDDRANWIRDPHRPVPALPAFHSGTESHAVMALVLSLVDGQRTLAQISETLAAESGLTLDQALEAAQSFFDRFLKDRRFRDGAS